MTPKEKANNFCVTFLMKPHTEELYYGINKELAKQCALIAVDEILESLIRFNWTIISDKVEYWQEVKEEIEKL